MKKVLIAFGTRPEAIKMCPLVLELERRQTFETTVLVTGQHKEMLYQVLDVFHVRPDIDLSIMKDNQTLYDVTVNILSRMKAILDDEKPDVVLVHGDTTSTFAIALAAFYSGIKIGHVEAGLRTYDTQSPYPEEFNRQAVSIIADFNFAPTKSAEDNLRAEGRAPATIFVTGNTAIDALKTTVQTGFHHEILDWAKGSRLILVTAHRRENLGQPMENMFQAITRIVGEFPDIKVVYPVHRNPQVREIAQRVLGHNQRIKIIDPVDVLDFHNIMAKAHIILTDSGGIQEEAPAFGIPVLVMRDNTERPEGIEAGTLKLVGTSEASIYQAFKNLLENAAEYDKMSQASNPFGDGFAAGRICDILEEHL